MSGARLLFDGLIDYAGLFPPAALPLAEVVARYGAYRRAATGWMLGRLVVPIEAYAALDKAVATLPDAAVARPWRVSVLGSGSVEDDRQTLADVASRGRSEDGRLRVDSVEVRVATPLDVRRARALVGDGWPVYCEPVGPGDSDALLDAIAIAGMRMKLRAGGPSAGDVPSAISVARTLAGCVQRGICLKATAGLHHAVTGEHSLTHDASGPCARTFGYLNLLVAAGVAESAGAAAVRAPEVVAALARLLSLTSPPVISAGGVLEWAASDGPLTEGRLHDIAASARALVRGIGTCWFEEPVAEARALHLV